MTFYTALCSSALLYSLSYYSIPSELFWCWQKLLLIWTAGRKLWVGRLSQARARRVCCYVLLGRGIKLKTPDQFVLYHPVKETLTGSLTLPSYWGTQEELCFQLFLKLQHAAVAMQSPRCRGCRCLRNNPAACPRGHRVNSTLVPI